MAHGLAVYLRNGEAVYSTADVTWNLVASMYVPAFTAESNVYPEIDGREVITTQMFVDAPLVSQTAIAHTIVVSGTTVSVSGGNVDAVIKVFMR